MKTEESLAGVAGVWPSGDSRDGKGGEGWGGGVSALQTVSLPKVSLVKLIMRNPIFRVCAARVSNIAAWPGVCFVLPLPSCE